jgi:glyoxylase-like metal-dependent hydrolase (beta-lactamase superfamily II)
MYRRTISRREWLKTAGVVGGGALVTQFAPGALVRAYAAQAAPPDALAAMRTQMGAAPIEATTLTDTLTMLSGPGGNVVVLSSGDGKIVVDGFVQTAWAPLKQRLDSLGSAPIRYLIDTHWHFDHTDNNANFRSAGATIVAHENTRKRMTETHNMFGMTIPPSPAPALPTQMFADDYRMTAAGEVIEMGYIPPAHTDTDIWIRYTRGNVLHMGDCFFNGNYPFIDVGTGGNINGMIAIADRALQMADGSTKIVPGHGPLADRAALTRYRDVIATIRDRVQKLKTAGRTLDEVVAAKPTAEFDDPWGKGFVPPNDFVAIVYNTV